jgi:hypothetical protein
VASGRQWPSRTSWIGQHERQFVRMLQAARFWERTSAKGTRYLQGRLGGVKLVILPNRDYVEAIRSTGTPTPCSSRMGRQRSRGRRRLLSNASDPERRIGRTIASRWKTIRCRFKEGPHEPLRH